MMENLKRNKLDGQNYVFLKRDGTLPSIRHISARSFKKAISKAGVPKIRLHDTRVTYASNYMVSENANLYTLSRLLGHSSVEMTAKKYAHLDSKFIKESSQTIEFDELGTNMAQPKLHLV